MSVADGVMPLDQAVDEFLDWQQLDKGRSLNTVRAYERDLADFTAYCAAVDVLRLADVGRELLGAYQTYLTRRRAGGKPLSAPTRHRLNGRSSFKGCLTTRPVPAAVENVLGVPLRRTAAHCTDPGTHECRSASSGFARARQKSHVTRRRGLFHSQSTDT